MRITFAAVRYQDNVYVGMTHADAYSEFYEQHGYEVVPEEGFVTNTGTFVSRYAAMKLAIRAKQVRLRDAQDFLRSEDWVLT